MTDPNLLAHLDAGLRLEQPSDCPDDVYRIMALCWDSAAEDRPVSLHVVLSCAFSIRLQTFPTIVKMLEALFKVEPEYAEIGMMMDQSMCMHTMRFNTNPDIVHRSWRADLRERWRGNQAHGRV